MSKLIALFDKCMVEGGWENHNAFMSAAEELESQLSASDEARKKAEATLKDVCNKVNTGFHGYDIDKLPEILISLSAKLFNNGGVFWEVTIDQMPAMVQKIKDSYEELTAERDLLAAQIKEAGGAERSLTTCAGRRAR